MGDRIRKKVIINIINNVADPLNTAIDNKHNNELATSPATVMVYSFYSY